MTERQVVIQNISDVPWDEFPGHFRGALSKPLVNADRLGAKFISHTISSFLPMAYSERHVHPNKEQIFHVLEGEGLFEYGNEKRVIRKHDVVFIPPGVEHGISNIGLDNLVFLVITSQPPSAG